MPARPVATIRRNRRDARVAKASSVYSNPSPRLRARPDPCAGLDFERMGPRWSGTSGGPSAKERALVEDARVAKANVARCKERIATHERTIASQQTLNVRLRERVDALESTVARILPKTSRETVLAELENARDAAATVKEAELRAARAGARLEAEIRARDAERRRMKHRALEVARERNAVGVRHHATLVRLRDVENEARFAAAEVRRLKAELDRPKPTRDVARDRSRARPVEDKSVDTADVVARRESIGEDEEEGADAVGGRVAAIRADVPAIVDWTPEPERVTVVIEVREPPPPPPPPPPPVVEERVVLCIVVVDPEPTPPPAPSAVESLAVDAGSPKPRESPRVVEAGVEAGDESVVTVTLTAEPPRAGRTPSKVASKVEALRKSRRFTRSGRHVERQFSATTKMMRTRRE